MLADRNRSQLLLIDFQERLLPAMQNGPETLDKAIRLALIARRLGVPLTLSEQYSKGLGHTVPDMQKAVGHDAVILEKITFSCWRQPALRERLTALRRDGRDQVVLVGLESHICVCQTALDLVAEDYDVFLAADGVDSRTDRSRGLAFDRMVRAGVAVASLEMIAFEWLERASTPEFRDLIGLIK